MISRRFKKVLKMAVLMLAAVVVLATIFSNKGLIANYKLKRQLQSMNERIEKLNQSNKYLRNELYRLRNDRHYIEDLARRELGLVQQGETVYRFPEK